MEVVGSNCDGKQRKGGNRVEVLRRKHSKIDGTEQRAEEQQRKQRHPGAFTGATFAGAFARPETTSANVPERWQGWRLGRRLGFCLRSIPVKEMMPRLRQQHQCLLGDRC
ncbi:hypothetical protein BHM03_00010637 [Ensete ventricosum]|nr:hypothetical protein BHM03_00010637 [Ensete ventricosum]